MMWNDGKLYSEDRGIMKKLLNLVKRETKWRWTLLAVGYSIALGWITATLIYQIGKLFTG